MGFSTEEKTRVYAKILTNKVIDNTKVLDPRFVIYNKGGDDFEEKEFTGRLTDIKFVSYEWENDTIPQIEFIFDDEGIETVVRVGYTGLMRNLVNNLAKKTLGLIHIRLYGYTSKEDKKERAGMEVKIDGIKQKWAYQPGELPKMNEIKVPKKKSIWDSEKLDEEIVRIIKEEIIPNIEATIPQSEPSKRLEENQEKKENPPADPLANEEDDLSSDLPF